MLYSQEWQVLEERRTAGVYAQYVWSPVYVDALVLRDRDTDANGSLDERLYVQQDANWNVTAVVNGAGQVQERYACDPYGQLSAVCNDTWTVCGTSSALAWVYLHQGGRYDGQAGLYHFRNRDYSPSLGRWLWQDPIEFEGGDSNLYRFVSNNPANRVDPYGLQATVFGLQVTFGSGNDKFVWGVYKTTGGEPKRA